MATLKEVRDKANVKLTEFWDALAIRQEAYLLKDGHYFQLLASDSSIEGADTNMVVRHPSDEKFQKEVQFNFASPLPFMISVDVFKTETSRGYSATACIEMSNGEKYKITRTLTDTRRLKRNIDTTDPDNPIDNGWITLGDAPTIETSNWEVMEDPSTDGVG